MCLWLLRIVVAEPWSPSEGIMYTYSSLYIGLGGEFPSTFGIKCFRHLRDLGGGGGVSADYLMKYNIYSEVGPMYFLMAHLSVIYSNHIHITCIHIKYLR